MNYFMFYPVCEYVSKIADIYEAIGGRNLFRPTPTLHMYFVHMESWLSGRKHLTANEAGSKSPRGFKSHTLRQ